jgi:6-phosphogluconolactonase
MAHIMNPETKVFPDAAALNAAATLEALAIATAAIAERGHCSIVLSGGRTPEQMYRLWASNYRDAFPWEHIHLFWGDERYVPPTHPRSNYRMVREALLDHVSIPPRNVHAMPTDFPLADDAAREAESALRHIFGGDDPEFDLVFLGIGGEGHTASLFPDSPALAERERWVVAVNVPADPPLRLTMTLPVLNASRNVFFIVTGSNKVEILGALRAESAATRYPAAMVRPAGRLVWFLDAAAAPSPARTMPAT